MAKFSFTKVKLAGCAVILGENEHFFDTEPEHYNNDPVLLGRLKKMIGFGTRYTAKSTTTTCDMCEQAARNLLQALHLQPSDIDGIISVTQTPDYYMPGNAHVLHKRLGLSTEAPALDVELGCSGFVYGLWLAAMQIASGSGRILLLAGDTLSKVAHEKDRTTAPLFGDAGSAAVIEYAPSAREMHFILRSHGEGVKKMYLPAGAYRLPSSPDTRREISLEDGGMRSQENVYMDGFGIFDFTMREQPELLKDILKISGKAVEDVDYFILHQGNRHIVETIAKKCGLPAAKVPSDIFTRFGNQNSASIPGTLCGALADAVQGKKLQAVFQGFGIGLSWGACQLELDAITCLKPECYSEEQGQAND